MHVINYFNYMLIRTSIRQIAISERLHVLFIEICIHY